MPRRISLAAVVAATVGFLSGCERTPEPRPAEAPVMAPTPAVVPAAPVAVPLPETTPTIESAPPAAPPAKRRDAPLPPGFVRMGAGTVAVADGQRVRTSAYAISRRPVTVAQLRAWAESAGGRRLPQLDSASDAAVVTDLDWVAADAYARWLSVREHRRYRLPSEAEWLRAAQGGRIDTQAQRQPTEPPLWEWTGDCWQDGSEAEAGCESRVLVGGEMAGSGPWGRAPMGARRPAASFRLVLELP